MDLVRGIVVLAALISAIQAARISNKQNKIPAGKDSSGKPYTPYLREWINMSVKNDPIIKVPIGGVLELECEAVGSPPPKVKWVHRSNLLQEAGFPEQNEVENTAIGKVKSRLVINCVMPHHHGVYECSGTSGSKKKVSAPIRVIIEENDDMTNTACERNSPKVPRVVSWGPTLLELADRDITFPCTAVGSPAPEIYWINNKNQIIDSDTISSHYKVLPTGDLLISQIMWEDMGTYTCVAQSSLGSDKVESFLYPVKKEE